MEKYIEVNGSWLFSDEYFLLTERGWLKAKDLQNGDKVIGVKCESIVSNIVECGKQPDTSIIGELADKWLEDEIAKDAKDNFTDREKYWMIEGFVNGYNKAQNER